MPIVRSSEHTLAHMGSRLGTPWIAWSRALDILHMQGIVANVGAYARQSGHMSMICKVGHCLYTECIVLILMHWTAYLSNYRGILGHPS